MINFRFIDLTKKQLRKLKALSPIPVYLEFFAPGEVLVSISDETSQEIKIHPDFGAIFKLPENNGPGTFYYTVPQCLADDFIKFLLIYYKGFFKTDIYKLCLRQYSEYYE